MNTNNADTTGLRGIPRAKALIACAEAQDAGKTIQLRGEFYEKWEDARIRLDFGDLTTNYRIKPEPREFTVYYMEDRDVVLHSSKASTGGVRYAYSDPMTRQIKVREVLE